MIRRVFRYVDEINLSVIGLILFLIASNTQTGWIYLLSGTVFGSLLSGAIFSRRALRPQGFRLHVPERAEQGSEFPVTLSWAFCSRGYPAFWRPLAPDLQVEQAGRSQAWLDPEQRQVRVLLRCAQRQRLREVRAELTCYGPLAWFAAYRTQVLPLEPALPILPRSLRLSEPQLQRWVGGQLGSQTRGGPSGHGDLRRLRDYQVGDDVRWIHWASSARTGQLVVRELSQGGAARLVLCYGASDATSTGAGEAFEWMLSWVWTFFQRARLSGWKVSLLGFDGSAWRELEEPDELADAALRATPPPPGSGEDRLDFWTGAYPGGAPAFEFLPEDFVAGVPLPASHRRIGPGQEPADKAGVPGGGAAPLGTEKAGVPGGGAAPLGTEAGVS